MRACMAQLLAVLLFSQTVSPVEDADPALSQRNPNDQALHVAKPLLQHYLFPCKVEAVAAYSDQAARADEAMSRRVSGRLMLQPDGLACLASCVRVEFMACSTCRDAAALSDDACFCGCR